MFSKLSILVPCYNEAHLVTGTLQKILDTTLDQDLQKEIIVVDDGSSDSTFATIQSFIEQKNVPVILLRNEQNSGKGFSVMKALQHASGQIVVIQDADLEYDPSDYNTLLKPILDNKADVVYGSRFIDDRNHHAKFYFHRAGNKSLTHLSNLFTKFNFTDMETGYKMFRTEFLRQVNIKEKRFGFEPEVTAKISRVKNVRIAEVGISYYGRTYEQGKKIKWTDGFKAIWCIIKYNVFSRK
jgi:glycosyltransferase involved in cell wall biosynthesis